jgi:hypothetical protein
MTTVGCVDTDQLGRDFPLVRRTEGLGSEVTGRCLACGGGVLEHLVDLGTSPTTTGALYASAEEARTVRCGQVDLVVCRNCGHVANHKFDATLVEYDGSYDNSLHFSPAFQCFAAAVAKRLVDSYGLAGKHVVEIGSGRGDFLAAVTTLARARGTGYDPTYIPEPVPPHLTFVADYFRPHQDLQHYDLLVCRHVLEHLDDPYTMLAGLRATAPAESVYYLEVPAAEFCFGPSGLWDCIYPHASYFSRASLRQLVERAGFEVLAEGTGFEEQFLWLEARPSDRCPGDSTASDVAEHVERLRGFSERWESTVSRWRQKIGESHRVSPGSAALWGAGAKAVTFLNAVDPAGRVRVVDLNPRKWGRFLPGTAHVVQPPESLAAASVSEVLIMNPVYRTEIASHLEELGVSAALVVV